ncbi:5054_t:CDS:2 [Funneliformis geosporum]|uniref:13608_t:CDS:1 n=1 Tax=Funneliformis geosporum TaxID=1117311 RepID=A0A9W4SE73_9GLOM|nr:5054_t:CDS:2 [Funneliformis geosporum]CAI2166391.1 13608_t:CDS:2 [Funneliformis geosporum]
MVSFNTTSLSERDLNIKLTLIFTKIGQLENAQKGIQELYELLLEHPECDVKVDAFLASAGNFFQKYLRKALAEITTREMKACGMIPKDTPPSNDKKSDFISNSINKKPVHKFPSTSNRCSHSSVSFNNNNTKISNNVGNHCDSSFTSDLSKSFLDKVSLETFDQTRSRLHAIFQYEKYKTGQKRSSLPNLHQLQSDSDRLELAKSILQSRPRYRRSTWDAASSLSSSQNRFSSPFKRRS